MKFLVLVSCALAVASAGYISPIAYAGHGIHLPVIGHNGVPVDTAEVQHAKAAHFAAHAEANARHGYVAYAAPALVAHSYAAPAVVAHAPALIAHVQPQAYPTTVGLPAVTHDGVPLNTPEVAAATANHVAAHHEALARNSPIHHYRKRRGIYAAAPWAYAAQHLPVIHNGVPVETAEVQHAKAAHFAAHAEVQARDGYVAHVDAPVVAAYAAPYAAPYAYNYEVPAIAHDGTPLDTAEVAHAKAAHFAAYNEAAARNHAVVPYAAAHYGYAAATPYIAAAWNGAPVDTPEVQHAKAAHFAAYNAAAAAAAH